jgi:hypothetical protein
MTRIIWKDIKDKVSDATLDPNRRYWPMLTCLRSSSSRERSSTSYPSFQSLTSNSYLDIDLKYYDLVCGAGRIGEQAVGRHC